MSGTGDLTAWQLQALRSALVLLSSAASTQLAHLEMLGTLPSLDELVLGLGDIQGVVPSLVQSGVVTGGLEAAVRLVDQEIKSLSDGPSEFWDREAIDGPEWARLRVLARRALAWLPRA